MVVVEVGVVRKSTLPIQATATRDEKNKEKLTFAGQPNGLATQGPPNRFSRPPPQTESLNSLLHHRGTRQNTRPNLYGSRLVSTLIYGSQFQGGAFDPWGGWGFEKCSALVNHEFARVFYKNNYAAGVSVFSLYMVRLDGGSLVLFHYVPTALSTNPINRFLDLRRYELGQSRTSWRLHFI